MSNSRIRIYNAECEKFMQVMRNKGLKVGLILTSPPYGTSRKFLSNKEKNMESHMLRYDVHIDRKTPQEYIDWCTYLFCLFDSILKPNGVVLWNVSYGNDVTQNKNFTGAMWLSIADIIQKTPFTVADCIVWKKKSALPNNVSCNKLTRICEFVFVMCRKDEIKTFKCQKRVTNGGEEGVQKRYENIFNFVEAANNDGANPYNKATYSTELCEKLLAIYADRGTMVYDPFMGTGTTAVACKKLGIPCVGTEISHNQCLYAVDRLNAI